MNKLRVKLKSRYSGIPSDLETGQEGWIQGYVQSTDDRTLAIVLFDDGLEAIPLGCLGVIVSN